MRKITMDYAEGFVKNISYNYNGTLTVCIVELKSGWFEIGDSSCINPAEYDKGLGEKYAKEVAMGKVLEKLAFLEKQGVCCK